MSTFSGTITVDWLLNELSEGDLAASKGPAVIRPIGSNGKGILFDFADGVTAPAEVDAIHTSRNTIAASATTNFDLGTGGGLQNRFNQTLVFLKIVAIIIVNRNLVATDILHCGPAVSNPFLGPWVNSSDLNTIIPSTSADRPGVFVAVNASGWAVTDGSADTFRVIETGTSNTVTFDLLVVGRTA